MCQIFILIGLPSSMSEHDQSFSIQLNDLQSFKKKRRRSACAHTYKFNPVCIHPGENPLLISPPTAHPLQYRPRAQSAAGVRIRPEIYWIRIRSFVSVESELKGEKIIRI